MRYNRPISLLVIDCDNLKRVNDEQGHSAGDHLLIALVKSINGQLRPTDILSRHGGDEFVVLLPETAARGALDIAEKIREAAGSISLVLAGKPVTTSVSIGVASFPADGNNLDLLLAHADRNMYEAKLAGRNRVVQ